MHIGLITPGFSASEADWCIPALLNLVRSLAQQHEVDVFTLRYPYHRISYLVYGARVYAFGGTVAAGLSRLPLMGRTLTSLVARHRHHPFDVLHGLWADEPGFFALLAGRLLKLPVVVSLLGGELVGFSEIGYGGQLSRIGRWMIRAALRGADCVTVGSQYLHRLAQPYVSSNRLLRMPLGVDTNLFHPGPRLTHSLLLAEGKLKLFHVASLTPVKDQRMLLQALSQVVLREPTVHLHIVGAGPLRREIEHVAEVLGLAGHVTFHGSVSHEQLPMYYRAADLCVLTSRHESQGMVTLEAAACGRATIGTAVGLLPELAPATRAVPVGDSRTLAEALLTTLQDSVPLIGREQAIREAVVAAYTLHHTVENLGELYGALAASSL